MANNDTNERPERSLNKQLILDEDEYTAALSHIIARDFFPSLVHLDATNDYLDAVRTRDPNLIAASVKRLEQASNTPLPGSSSTSRRLPTQTPGRTPYASFPSDTPFHGSFEETGESDERASKRPRYDTSLSLDEFQARYTSEDNSSFTQILDEENQKRKEKYTWAWEAQKKVEAQRERMIEARERMLIEPAGGIPGVREKFRIEAPTPAGLITAAREEKGKEKDEEEKGEKEDKKDEEMAVVLKATSVEEATEAVMAPRKDQRTAGVDGWKFKTRNSLMFSPDADVAAYHPPIKANNNVTSERKLEPKVISHGNTRLVEQEHRTGSSRLSEPPSPTRSRIDAAISGTPYRPKSPSLSDIEALVPTLPNPTPEQLGPEAVKQLMTWGTLNATPRILSRPENEDVAEPKTPFHIREMSSREALSRKLANSASKSLRNKAEMMGLPTPGISRGTKPKGNMGPPSWTPKRAEAAGNLTPAARRLLERSTLGAAAARKTDTTGLGSGQERDLNRVRWTPTPASTRRAG
ncbi:hypothetical protein D9756_003867 [Leucocoprinus leucothites]|uniref:Uncharacterized protein n=1 Tax=Leucocoprinus leucothites TaxID=201217 RepID=A0A8H5DB65_9AGAR|nr:hypothetical protein D9756_003867 [Leucoagaricus leucothites]